MSSDFLHQKVLITGARGFIGSHLCTRLSNDDAEVNAISRAKGSDYKDNVSWWRGDLEDITVARDLITRIKPDIIFHLAGYPLGGRELLHVMPSFRSNLLSTVNLLISASEVGCRRIILAGSMEEPADDPQAIPSSPYAASKWASSAYARMFHVLYQLPVVLLHVSMVYGPGQRLFKKLIPYIILCLLRGENPKLSSGQRIADWIYIDDVVEGLLAAAKASDIEGKTIDIGSGKLVSVRTIAETLGYMINPKIELHFGALQDRPLEQKRVADIARSNVLIGWKPKIDLEEGLKYTMSWYRQKLDQGSI